MTPRWLGVAVAAMLGLSACSGGDRMPAAEGTGGTALATGLPPAGDIPITQRAIAAVALEQLPQDTSRREASYTDKRNPKGDIGADLMYDGSGVLTIFISPKVDKDQCPTYVAGCVKRKVEGGTLILSWVKEEPDEDPGAVDVVLQRRGQQIRVDCVCESITGDPRKQDLHVSVAAMMAIAQDPRLGLTTSQQTIDEGRALTQWDGGEPDPTAYDRVTSTDQALINSYWSAHGGYGAFHRRQSSPLKKQFDPGAVGGRFTADGNPDEPAQTIDVLASRQGPTWLADDPCETKRFAGHCVSYSTGRYFAWVAGPPADGGVVWMFQQRSNEIVAIRKSGFTVAEDAEEARLQADWYFADSYLKSDTLGLKTDKVLLTDLSLQSD